MNQKRILLAAGLLWALLLVGYFVASPWMALAQFKEDAQARRAEKMADYVDFAAVQASLKAQLRGKLKAEMLRNKPDGGFAAAAEMLGAAVANLVLDPVVDRVASPQGMVAIMNGENPLPGLNRLDIALPPTALAEEAAPHAAQPPSAHQQAGKPAGAPADSAGADTAKHRRQWKLAYTAWNRAVIRAVPAEEGAPYLVMQRKGLFGWQVVDVQLGKLW